MGPVEFLFGVSLNCLQSHNPPNGKWFSLIVDNCLLETLILFTSNIFLDPKPTLTFNLNFPNSLMKASLILTLYSAGSYCVYLSLLRPNATTNFFFSLYLLPQTLNHDMVWPVIQPEVAFHWRMKSDCFFLWFSHREHPYRISVLHPALWLPWRAVKVWNS